MNNFVEGWWTDVTGSCWMLLTIMLLLLLRTNCILLHSEDVPGCMLPIWCHVNFCNIGRHTAFSKRLQVSSICLLN